MDTDFIAALAAILLAAVIGWAEKYFGKKKSTKQPPRQADKPVLAATRTVAESATRAAQKQTTKAPKPFLNTEEGTFAPAAMLKDDKPAAAPAPPQGLRPLNRDDLRNAIIWGEILKPKY